MWKNYYQSEELKWIMLQFKDRFSSLLRL